MSVYIWYDGAAMPNGGPAGAGYVVVGGVHLLGSEALGDTTKQRCRVHGRSGSSSVIRLGSAS
jgi:ribonuclease HI